MIHNQFVDQDFRKSSASRRHGDRCVEVKRAANGVCVRDSKNPDKGYLFFTPDEWTCFIDGVKNDEFQIK